MNTKLKKINKIPALFLSILLSLIMLSSLVFAGDMAQEEKTATARPSVNGMLHVDKANLVDQKGKRVVLRGLSTHGLTWFPEFVNEDLFKTVSTEWNCNLIRLAAYSQQYASGFSDETLKLVRRGIDAAIDADMYVLVDWHILEEKDPHVNMEYAKEFFSTICSEYPNDPHILYEICNEPNGEATWSDVKDYAEVMIPYIREMSPENVILVGTPEYDRDLMAAVRSPLHFDNIMYVLHFYTATHYADLLSELRVSQLYHLPVFISECGVSEASGDGKLDFENAAVWFKYLNENNISYTVWSLSNKSEASALLKNSYDVKKPLTEKDLTRAGIWVRQLIQGTNPDAITAPQVSIDEDSILNKVIRTLNPIELIPIFNWPNIAGFALIIIIINQFASIITEKTRKYRTYEDIKEAKKNGILLLLRRFTLVISSFFTIMYLAWRLLYSIPKESGILPVIANVILLIVEIIGFLESLILYLNLMYMKDHPLPEIADDEYPDVDIFIATYNEPEYLLRKTINGCNHIIYPDKSKVHIWVCDDTRRPEIRKLAEDMHVGYFDRENNEGAKAGNLNNAMRFTNSPYVVTLDADMIPQKGFLMKTIPYFVDAEKHSKENGGIKLGLIQTPQCFYQPDVFQHALFSEKTAPNEQDFFYRTIEVAKTSTNSVIYGGSNTVLSREAVNAAGGFYTKSITEDFATGLLIESAGYVSLALSTPLASGMSPSTYEEHIKQRQRWGRGVIGTAKQLRLLTRPGLSLTQRLSYLSSVIYWYSPIKTLIYLVSPLLFAAFTIPMFKCSWADLLLYWLPMFIMQDVCIRVFSGNALSLKWSGIYETSVMPHLLVPVLKETFGMTASKFIVTDKSGKAGRRKINMRLYAPFLILIGLSVWGIIRSIYVLIHTKALGIFILLFWLIRNLYFLVMSVFLIDGRDGDSEPVKVTDAEMLTIRKHAKDGTDSDPFYGVTTYMTEHSLKAFLDETPDLSIGDKVKVSIEKDDETAEITGVITGITTPHTGKAIVYSIEILDLGDSEFEYLQVLYDRIPTLPQTLNKDLDIIRHMLINIAHRILG